MIELKQITYQYSEHTLDPLRFPDCKIESGEVVLLTGPNGSGKTTLLKIIAGIAPKFTGGELHGSRTLNGSPYDTIDPYRFGFLFHGLDHSFLQSRVDQELLYVLENWHTDGQMVHERFKTIVDVFGLQSLMDRQLEQLSSGEIQIVKIALAFILNPRIVLMDEPLSHLDVGQIEKVMKIFQHLQKEKQLTYVIAEHNVDVWLKYFEPRMISLGVRPNQNHDYPLYEKSTVKGEMLISFDNLSFAYDTAAILKNFSGSVDTHQIVAVCGRNGAGKTTLLDLIMNHLQVQSGQIKQSKDELKKKMLVNPLIHNFFSMKFKDEIKNQKTLGNQSTLFEVHSFFDRYVFDLSQGEQGKAALELMFRGDVELLLLDEPFLHLDQVSRAKLIAEMGELRRRGKTIVFTTHDQSAVSAFADQVWLLE